MPTAVSLFLGTAIPNVFEQKTAILILNHAYTETAILVHLNALFDRSK